MCPPAGVVYGLGVNRTDLDPLTPRSGRLGGRSGGSGVLSANLEKKFSIDFNPIIVSSKLFCLDY